MRTSMNWLATAFVFLLTVSLAAQKSSNPAPASSDQPSPKVVLNQAPAPNTNPASGKQMYDSYCASCHGLTGKGNGPAAPALKVQPTNLTQLSANNGGKFPDAHVAQVIKGDTLASAHGNQEMPVWGKVFSNLGSDQAVTQLRIHNLSNYLESIQQK
jgi:mono/diheme cytochrome c family protein